MAEEVEIDQEVYDRLIAEGKSERIARAKAKAAAVRKAKLAAGEQLGPREPSEQVVATAPTAAQPVAAAAAGVSTGEATGRVSGVPAGRLTPEQRAARVAGALNGGDGAAKLQSREDHTHRLLALIPPEGIQQVRTKQADKVYTWPHLLAVEFVSLLAVTSLLLVVSYFIDPAFRGLANPNLTPNPSKAPWYFLGLQELLRYFHPMVAGVTIPGVGLVLLGAAPYFDKNPSVRPENRKFANMAFTFFMVMWTWLVLFGSFFRGPGFNFVWPWIDGLWFEL
ncbi:MAG: menaquinol-cytochrome c reductase cytochrome b subunit [Actinomycetota bacterium]|nr:menaquinol-cytochrome c reductase cytochrome b subunit [Actinomycetota bacterium]